MEQSHVTQQEGGPVDWRRVAIFCALAFAISGSAAVYIAARGGLGALAGLQGVLVLALWYMPGPAFAHLLTRALTREGWRDLWLRPNFRRGWPAWLIAWFLPALFVQNDPNPLLGPLAFGVIAGIPLALVALWLRPPVAR